LAQPQLGSKGSQGWKAGFFEWIKSLGQLKLLAMISAPSEKAGFFADTSQTQTDQRRRK
jgi:hypothetical protein